jgi:hypothetical protein
MFASILMWLRSPVLARRFCFNASERRHGNRMHNLLCDQVAEEVVIPALQSCA